MSLSKKALTKIITKSELEYLYFDKLMTLDEIGRHYGYIDRQPIMRLFKKHNIQSRTKSENAKLINTNTDLPKYIVEKFLKEDDYIKNPEKVVEECLNFLKQ